MRTPDVAPPHDAILVMSFGGPEGPDDVLPFLERVTRGRGIPPERLAEVGQHYHLFGGVSPINAQNRALIGALEPALAARGVTLPIYFGNRNGHPLITDTVQRMADDGVERALMLVTSAYASYSGCRQYREDLARAQAAVGERAPRVDKVRHYYNHPGFIAAHVDHVKAALATLPEGARVAFTAHSVPLAMAQGARYEAQLSEAARLIAERVGDPPWSLVYQSRSGPPQVPWLEPDICDHLEALAAAGTPGVVIAPIGFISDHMEVIYDLDTEARQRADALGLAMARAATPGVHPAFVAALCELIEERLRPGEVARRALGAHGPSWDRCPDGCCPYTPRRP